MISKIINKILTYTQFLIAKQPRIDYNINSNKEVLRGPVYFSFSKDIITYAVRNPEKIIELKSNLDIKSIEIVNNIFERFQYIYTHNVLERNKIISFKEMRKYLKYQKSINESLKSSNFYLKDYEIGIFYYKHGLKYIPEEVILNLNDKDFIDGGAYIGDSALMFEKYYKPKKIYSFEPNINNYNILKKTIKENNLKKVIPIFEALGHSQSYFKLKDLGHASYISEKGTLEIKVNTIDNFTSEKILNVGLIKLDIEGFELEALKGAKNTIKEKKPILLISIYHNADGFFGVKNYIEELKCGYKIIIRKLAPLKPFFDTNLIAWVEK